MGDSFMVASYRSRAADAFLAANRKQQGSKYCCLVAFE